jgi:NADPH-dependent 2,4-dienoyl-CoA reductase/sulfur reductase-like enzyme/nitrite reductase/ring-hydroxylating ferredoxin subunit
MLLGHAAGEAVVLVRRGARAFAIAASCPHYGAPLAKGLVVGDTLRCPWHHACFDLATGAVRSPPALNPPDTWDVRIDGALVYVGGKRQVAAPSVHVGDPRTFVIVGAGAAGAVAAETLRNEGFRGRVVLIGEDPSAPYDRPNLSKDYLAGNAPEEWIPLRPDDFYASRQIELRVATRVASLDVGNRSVTLENGERIRYDALLLATGARPVRLSVPGADLPHVYYLRTLADSRRLVEAAKTARRAVVIGSSFIGLEVAAALVERGLSVSVIGMEALPLERALGAELGQIVKGLHESHGVRFHLEVTAKRITASEVTLASGVSLPADVVVIGVGVSPATELAEAAGLRTDHGIIVDEYLEASAPGVYAAGDVARYPDRASGEIVRVEHWVLAQRHGRAAALNMLGRKQPFTSVPFFWSNHYDLAIRYSGFAPRDAERQMVGQLAAQKGSVVFRKRGRITAVATVGDDLTNLIAEAALEGADYAGLERLVR